MGLPKGLRRARRPSARPGRVKQAADGRGRRASSLTRYGIPFSVRFLETHPGEVEALQRMLGHARMETAARYTRAMERMRLAERNRDLSWDSRFDAMAAEARTGFEPVYEALQASA